MSISRRAIFVTALAAAGALAAFTACGDDDNVVRTRPDGGLADATTEGGPVDAGPNVLACGVSVPATYESPAFATNAKAQLDLKARVLELDAKMRSTESASTAIVTGAELQAIFTAGTPSLRAVATAATQAVVDQYLVAFGDAVGKTWSPLDAEDGGTTTGGKYEGTYHFTAAGIDIREATQKTLLGGALYNHALTLATGPITEATVDGLLALFGATPKLANATDGDAGADADELIAEYASRRDNKASTTPGPYRRIASALRAAKAAAAAGDKCKADLDAALKIYFAEWERATYLTAIFYLNAAATNATATPPKGSTALHAYGEALGLVQSFRGIPQDRRKITDAQIDALLQRIGATTPYQLVTRTSERVVAFNTAFQDIGAIYGMTQIEIEDAKKSY